MCAEGLSAIIRRNESAGLLHGCTIARGAPTISHLLFADDCYFFFKAKESEAEVMKRILNRYERASGQVVNFDKSLVTFSPNTSEGDRKNVCTQLGVREASVPGRYLGLPMCIGRNKTAEFGFLLERIDQKLQGWAKSKISKAGKMTLLKTAAQSIPNFWMNLMLIPNEICEKIERKMNSFWWGNGKEANGGIRWLAWDKLCAVKEAGGLGFKRMRDFNLAMLSKQAWRLINNSNSLVSQLMQAKYYPKTDFMNASLGSNPSYVWRSIHQTQGVIKQGGRRRIGDGEDTRVWEVPWLPCGDNGYMTTEMPEVLRNATVQSLMDDSKKQWDEEVLIDLFNERDRVLIQQVPIPVREKKDTWYWILDEKGEFSVRSCYRRLRGEEVCEDRAFWRRVWNLELPSKVINLLWRVARAVLPVAVSLRDKHVNIDDRCGWCQGFSESINHVLFECKFAREVWEMIGLQNILQVEEGDSALQVLKRVFISTNKQQRLLVGIVCWCLWLRRNKWVWEKISLSVFGVKSMAVNMLNDWKKARDTGDRVIQNRTIRRGQWSKPPEDWVKVNIDASCRQGGQYIGTGCVVRDHLGSFVRARTNLVRGRTYAREAEALSLKEALSWMMTWRTSKCIFEMDAKLVVEAIQKSQGQSIFDTIIEDCKEFLKHFEEVLFVYVHRSANNVAHLLAQAAYSKSGPQEWCSIAPDFIMCNLALEAV